MKTNLGRSLKYHRLRFNSERSLYISSLGTESYLENLCKDRYSKFLSRAHLVRSIRKFSLTEIKEYPKFIIKFFNQRAYYYHFDIIYD